MVSASNYASMFPPSLPSMMGSQGEKKPFPSPVAFGQCFITAAEKQIRTLDFAGSFGPAWDTCYRSQVWWLLLLIPAQKKGERQVSSRSAQSCVVVELCLKQGGEGGGDKRKKIELSLGMLTFAFNPSTRRQGWVNLCALKASLVHQSKFKTTRAVTQRNSISKKQMCVRVMCVCHRSTRNIANRSLLQNLYAWLRKLKANTEI